MAWSVIMSVLTYGCSIGCIDASSDGFMVLPALVVDGEPCVAETVPRIHRSHSTLLYRTNAERHEGQKRKMARAAELVSIV